MMFTQWGLAVPVSGVALAGLLRVLGSAIAPESGIVVHSLTFTNDPNPAIVQDRTVTAGNALTAEWNAEIRVSGVAVDDCKGSGFWPYPAGRKTPVIEIDEWTARAGCWDALPEGVTLQACAEYIWGDGQSARQCSLGFRKVN